MVLNLILVDSHLLLPNIDYDIRRKLDKAFSSTSELQYGNNVITANVQNVYNKEDDEYYVEHLVTIIRYTGRCF